MIRKAVSLCLAILMLLLCTACTEGFDGNLKITLDTNGGTVSGDYSGDLNGSLNIQFGSSSSGSSSGNVSSNSCDHAFSNPTCTDAAICSKCGTTNGKPLGHNYILGECDRSIDGKICGHYNPSYCPKLYLTGNMDGMTKKSDTRKVKVEYRSSDKIVEGTAKIKIQGTSSLAYDKKNYTINLYDDDSYSNKLNVNFGWGKQSKYCLKANWVDKTHSRNIVTAKLASEMQAKYGLFNDTPNHGVIDGYPIEIYINGEFHGIYTLNIPKDAWMFNMDEDNPNHIVVCGEFWNQSNWFKADPNFTDWSVEVGEENDETLAKLTRLFSFIQNSSDKEFVENFDQYLNLDATLNYYIMLDYAWMRDNRGKNMLLVTYDGKVWYPSLYDMDTSWGPYWDGTLEDYENRTLTLSSSLLFERLEKLFSKELAQRYFELNKGILSKEHIMDTFNSFYAQIPAESLAREIQKWGTDIPGYDLTQIDGYLDAVIPQLNKKYNIWK